MEASAGAGGGRFLLAAARPLGEPIARYGPFVMNTRAEIEQTLEDLRAGRFVRDAPRDTSKGSDHGASVAGAGPSPMMPFASATDRVQRHQAVSNLVANAVKFTPPGGRIEVSVEQANEPARLTVEDTGEGVEPSGWGSR